MVCFIIDSIGVDKAENNIGDYSKLWLLLYLLDTNQLVNLKTILSVILAKLLLLCIPLNQGSTLDRKVVKGGKTLLMTLGTSPNCDVNQYGLLTFSQD